MRIWAHATATMALCVAAATPAMASDAAAREVCKQFISRSGYSVKDWGESWNWKTIDNKDGTWSVGARFDGMPPGGGLRNLYVVCTSKKKGDNWTLEGLNRLQ